MLRHFIGCAHGSRGHAVISQQELEQRLLAACNCLRGSVDPTDYNAYIFALLFLKRISDFWDGDRHARSMVRG